MWHSLYAHQCWCGNVSTSNLSREIKSPLPQKMANMRAVSDWIAWWSGNGMAIQSEYQASVIHFGWIMDDFVKGRVRKRVEVGVGLFMDVGLSIWANQQDTHCPVTHSYIHIVCPHLPTQEHTQDRNAQGMNIMYNTILLVLVRKFNFRLPAAQGGQGSATEQCAWSW